MRIKLLIAFLFLGFLSNLLGILINPISLLIAVPFALYIYKIEYRWGYLLILSYYIGLFKIGPFLLNFAEYEIPILFYSSLFSIIVFTLGSYIPYFLIVIEIKRLSSG